MDRTAPVLESKVNRERETQSCSRLQGALDDAASQAARLLSESGHTERIVTGAEQIMFETVTAP
jgi:hypothetical protein